MSRTIFVCAAMVAMSAVVCVGETISIDLDSPSSFDAAALLNPGPSVQIDSLAPGGDVNAISSGRDAVGEYNIVFFSVDRQTEGISGQYLPQVAGFMELSGQSAFNQQAGDVYVTVDPHGTYISPPDPDVNPGQLGLNQLQTNQNSPGLAPVTWAYLPVADGVAQDNLDALSFEEFDLNADLAEDRPIYMSFAPGTIPAGFTSADILVSQMGANGREFDLFASYAQMGLDPGDDIDALALLDMNDNQIADDGDFALFSLARGSPTLIANDWSGADIFITGFDNASGVRYGHRGLGVEFDGEVDALEVQIGQAPEPMTLTMLAAAGLMAIRRRRLVRSKQQQ